MSGEENSKTPVETPPKTESESDATKMDIDITQGDWKESNGPIYYSSSKRLWYCLNCRIVIDTPHDQATHAKTVHGLTTISSKDKKEKTGDSEEDDSSSRSVRKDLSVDEIKKLMRSDPTAASALIDPADLALQINTEMEAKHVAALVKNPYVLYMFSKMKDERIIYPDWNIADALREGFLVLADKLGCYASFGQDMEKVSQDPHFKNVVIKIAEAWSRYDEEEALEAAKPKRVTTSEIHESKN